MEPVSNETHEPAIRRARLRVAYHGAFFHGFATNGESEAVEDVLIHAMKTVLRAPVVLSTAGRTDAGVHSRGQIVSLDLPADTHLPSFMRSINSLCKPHISVSDVEWAQDDFDARYSATWRRYRYFVYNADAPDPLLLDRAWHVYRPLSLPLMNLAADALIGHLDFGAFCKRAPIPGTDEPKSMMRYVLDAKWVDEGEGHLYFEIRANAFCHQMVRGIVGFLVDVGLGKRPASDTRAVMVARDRAHGSVVAPPHGLVLWDVGYEGTRLHPK
jgi:tRNA pseudouridine38-40 synthase